MNYHIIVMWLHELYTYEMLFITHREIMCNNKGLEWSKIRSFEKPWWPTTHYKDWSWWREQETPIREKFTAWLVLNISNMPELSCDCNINAMCVCMCVYVCMCVCVCVFVCMHVFVIIISTCNLLNIKLNSITGILVVAMQLPNIYKLLDDIDDGC